MRRVEAREIGRKFGGARRSVIAFWSESPQVRRFRPKFASDTSWRASKYKRLGITDQPCRIREYWPVLKGSDHGPSKPRVPDLLPARQGPSEVAWEAA